MRAIAAISMVLLAPASCKRSPPDAADSQAPSASSSVTVSASASAPFVWSADSAIPTGPAEPVAGQYGRYFIDMKRFSAAFPVSPLVKPLPGFMFAVEAHQDDGSAYVIICRPVSSIHDEFAHAKEQTVGAGKLLSETHPPFYTGEAYEVHAKLPDGSERFERFVKYAARFCSIGAEIVSPGREQEAIRFIESFRPEPPPK